MKKDMDHLRKFDVPEVGNVRRKDDRDKLIEQKEKILRTYRIECKKNFKLFMRGLTIDSQSGPRVFENCIAPFQRETFDEIAPALQALRVGDMPYLRRFWIERTKKASKDADLAVIVLWIIGFPVRPIYVQVGAGNKTQAAIVKQRIVHLLHYNKWLNEFIEVVQWEVRSKKKLEDGSPMALLHIMSSDISGAHGGTPDLLIINELSHVDRWEFVENLMDNADGVSQGIVIIATNAGYKGTPAEVWRNNALTNKAEWGCHILSQPAPWHTKETVKDAERRNSKSRFKRLWWGIWASGKGDAIEEGDLDSAFVLAGEITQVEPGYIYLLGLDLGISHDHSGLAAAGVNPALREIKLAYIEAWEPLPDTGKVDLIAVKEKCLVVAKWLRPFAFFYDPHQAELMSQELAQAGVPMKEMSFSNHANCTMMATCLLNALKDKILKLFDNAEGRLRRDLGKFNIVEKKYGYHLESTRDQFGHADVGTALAILLPGAIELLGGFFAGIGADETIVSVDEDDLTEEEFDNLPDEFKDLIIDEESIQVHQRVKGRSKHSFGVDGDPFADID